MAPANVAATSGGANSWPGPSTCATATHPAAATPAATIKRAIRAQRPASTHTNTDTPRNTLVPPTATSVTSQDTVGPTCGATGAPAPTATASHPAAAMAAPSTAPTTSLGNRRRRGAGAASNRARHPRARPAPSCAHHTHEPLEENATERTSQHGRDLIRHCQHAVHARTLESLPPAIPPLRVSAGDRPPGRRWRSPRGSPATRSTVPAPADGPFRINLAS